MAFQIKQCVRQASASNLVKRSHKKKIAVFKKKIKKQVGPSLVMIDLNLTIMLIISRNVHRRRVQTFGEAYSDMKGNGGPHHLIMRMKFLYFILFIYFINICFSLMIFSMSHFWCWLSNSTLNTDCIIQTYIGTKHSLHIPSLTILDAIKKDAQINS